MIVTCPRSDVTAIEDLGADTAGLCVVTRPRSDVTAIVYDRQLVLTVKVVTRPRSDVTAISTTTTATQTTTL